MDGLCRIGKMEIGAGIQGSSGGAEVLGTVMMSRRERKVELARGRPRAGLSVSGFTLAVTDRSPQLSLVL